MMPILWEGNSTKNGNPNPVALVSTVLTRKTAVQPWRRFAWIQLYITTKPEAIPIRLIRVWTNVNGGMPKIMEGNVASKLTGRLSIRHTPLRRLEGQPRRLVGGVTIESRVAQCLAPAGGSLADDDALLLRLRLSPGLSE